ncbi:Ankyrin repeat-containing protein [Cladophialophora immunda]|nr:Ankyrin repeat-containing protein [Cladophialophora immunda]
MDGVSVASSIAGLVTLALQVSATIAIYVNSIKERANTVRELHDELLLLGEVLSGLRDFLESEKVKGRALDTQSVLSKAIRDCRQRMERIGDRLKPSDGGKVARAIDHLRWPFEQREVMQMVENLRRYTQTFQFAFTIEGFNLLSKTSEDATKGLQEMLLISKKMSELSAQMGRSADESSKLAIQLEGIIALVPVLARTAADVNEISQATRLAELREQERRTTDILDWLAPLSSLHKHRDLQVRRAEGTGRWFLEHPHFSQWVDGDSKHDLLCVGGPGAGKSVLCSHAVDYLRTKFKDHDVAIAFYYYDYSDQQSQNPSSFARSLLRQLSSHSEVVPSAVAEFYQRTRNAVKDQTWFHDLLNIIRRVVRTFSHCFIIVDALDEADVQSQRSGFFEVIDAIRSSPRGTVKVLATLRPHVLNLVAKFHEPSIVDILANPGDIRQFLVQMIQEQPESEYLMDDKLKEHVLNTLCTNANGMFLLPALQIKTILDQITKADVKRALLHLSTDLTHAFQSTIKRISTLSSVRRELAFRTLMWASHARRPMTVRELQHAMALRPEDHDLDKDNLPSVRTLIDCCCGLVEVDYESSIIRLVHHSLEEYLRDHDHGLFNDANLIITRTCLQYMRLDIIRDLPYKNRKDFGMALEDVPFLQYAALEWGHHAYSVPAEEIKDLALPLLSDSACLNTIARVRDFQSPDLRKWNDKAWTWAYSGGAGISLAAGFGLTELLKILIAANQHNLQLDARNMYGSTALHEAAFFGHQEVAKILVENGANLLDTNYGQSTPIFLAVSYGQLEMVKLLLRYGRDQLDCPGPKGFTALHKAVEQGDEEMVTILLQEGALLGATDNQGTTALHVAAFRGYLSIAESLVRAGAVVHVKDKEGLCPLDYAATGGFTDVVAFLLENGGSMFHKGRELWTPLHRAARGGHTETVAFFLKRDANVLATDFRGTIPLHLAVRSGNIETVKTLLEQNTNPNLKRAQLFVQDRKGSTPRIVAFFTAHYDIHKYLRAAEWQVQGITSPSSANQLTTAIERGDLPTVRTHLDKNRDSLTSLDEDGQPPLHVALQENQKHIVAFLLSRGAPVEAVGYHGWRALHIAASLGNLELVELCLSHGAHVDTRTNTQQTALHKAASSKSVAVVRRLLSAGADPAAANERGMTALHIAAHQNSIGIVRMLVLECGVDILARDRQSMTASMWAERSAHLDVCAFLRSEERKLKQRKRSRAVEHVESRPQTRTDSAESLDLKEVGDALGDVNEDGTSQHQESIAGGIQCAQGEQG